MSQSVCILGVTGSIGQSTLKILQQHAECYSVFAVTAHSRMQELVDICQQFIVYKNCVNKKNEKIEVFFTS